MTFKLLKEILEKSEVPSDVLLLSDSGWEVDATHMNGVYYNKNRNVIVFTQTGDEHGGYREPEWKLLYAKEFTKEDWEELTNVFKEDE